ncbi:diguanylate cyclase [Photobacterium kishitanii]|uniref:diguanylate cyclase n=2 Tax=Photobacterium kishitanii TaxID=318456 RepID=A0AAX0Z0Q9_9GAMM|nr:GGDEF domain-containing protein [Photobacterium kishitanii]KJG62504.1 diguanylate cyclase [Photobacterium kishitanii]KJG70754.1 diguanylate cyclase [Photobacterium kishitanii]PSX21126.1 GGDEF domain-containing protein [Photobacterium kishitanii]PSX29929.1 GGDEF domain-containing protein [Photobacterium kishitanii]PSX35341.1 GGDEF domain-containing protein [Photobacterium kishitanii]
MIINLNSFLKKSLSNLKLFTLFFIVCSSLYLIYNIFNINKLHQKYITTLENVYSGARRFGSFYNNTGTEDLKKGQYLFNGVSVVVNTPTQAKILSTGINKLRLQINKITENHIWTVAVFETSAKYSHFDPLRSIYLKLYDHVVLNSIVKNEGLTDTYQSFYGCNIKLTDIYKEQGTNEILRTVYFPIYNNKKLDALLAIDINNSIFKNILKKYNRNKITIISMKDNNLYQKSELLPCSEVDPINLGINFYTLFKFTFLPSILLMFLYHSLTKLIANKNYILRYDQMTRFYRRDYYEAKLLNQADFNLLIIDIDHFKTVNDTYGHEVGDEVIRGVTKRINNCIRKNDIAIRWGGEEFMLSFPKMNNEQLTIKAQQICDSIALYPISDIDISVSIGGISATSIHFNDAYKAADQALYHSKNNGRNQVTII